MKGKAGRAGVVVHVPHCKWIAYLRRSVEDVLRFHGVNVVQQLRGVSRFIRPVRTLNSNRSRRIVECFEVMLHTDTSYFLSFNELVIPIHKIII